MTAGRVLLGTLVTTALVVLPTAPAVAHTQAIASWPASGQVLTELPERVTVAYDTEFLPPVEVAVADPFGASVADGDPVVVGQALTQALTPSAEPGVYGAFFSVVGDDGHLVEGYFEFTVDPDGVATQNPAGPEPELGLDDEAAEAPETVDDAEAADESEGSTGTALLLTGLAGAALLVLVIRILGRRRRG